MLTTQKFNEAYWKMFDAGIIEDECKKDKPQIMIEEFDGCNVRSHLFEVADVNDAKEKIKWLIGNTECYEVVFFNPGNNPITWRAINDHEWAYYYG